MVRKLASAAFVCLLVISLPAYICQAVIYPFQIFTYTAFNKTPSPGDLPSGNLLVPPFVADKEFSIGAASPPPWRGVNNGDTLNEWVTISFQLSGDLTTLLGELNNGTLRVGLHVIGLPDGSSESAILIPEPATVLLLRSISFVKKKGGLT